MKDEVAVMKVLDKNRNKKRMIEDVTYEGLFKMNWGLENSALSDKSTLFVAAKAEKGPIDVQ